MTISLLMRIEVGGEPIGNTEPPTLRVFQIDGASMDTKNVKVVEQVVGSPFVDDIAVGTSQNGIVFSNVFTTNTFQKCSHFVHGL